MVHTPPHPDSDQQARRFDKRTAAGGKRGISVMRYVVRKRLTCDALADAADMLPAST